MFLRNFPYLYDNLFTKYEIKCCLKIIFYLLHSYVDLLIIVDYIGMFYSEIVDVPHITHWTSLEK